MGELTAVEFKRHCSANSTVKNSFITRILITNELLFCVN